MTDLRQLGTGDHLRLVARGSWEYVTRMSGTGVVAIIAITGDRELVLVEQFRPPVNRNVIELPAGVAGDLADAPDESLRGAAERELLEETGFRGQRWTQLHTGYPSAGITDEALTFFLAQDLERVAPGGGDASENITVHLVPLDDADQWLEQQMRAGLGVDAKLHGAMHLARARL